MGYLMNIYFTVILVAMIGGYVLDLIADILNLKALKPQPPEDLADLYDPSEYAKSQAYTIVTTKFGIIKSTFSLVMSLIFWLAGGFRIFDDFAVSFGFGSIVTGLIYTGLLIAASSVIMFPFSIYSTFVIEEKFGFNKTTVKTFIMDIIKGVCLGVIIGTPLLAGIFAFLTYTGTYAWLWCWAVVTFFMLAIQFVAPTWIMPLFNKFTPLEDGELRQAIMDFAKKADFPLSNVFVMDGSKRSAKSNAFFTGFGKNRRIALFDTLIEKHTVPELVAVLAHEAGHYKKGHIIKSIAISILYFGFMFWVLSVFISEKGLFDAFFMERVSVYAGLVFFSMLFSPVEMILSIGLKAHSRANEYEADRFAVENTGGSSDLVSALKKLHADNLANLTPHPFYVFLNYTHPPVSMRIKAMKTI